MHPTACLDTPLIVLLQGPACLRTWLESLPPRQSVGERLCASGCPIVSFLKAHGVPVAHIDPTWIVLTNGQYLATPEWMGSLAENVDTHLQICWDSTTIDLSVTASDMLALMAELDEDA